MTNFIYNMQDELFNLNTFLSANEILTITKLVDHIEAQGKQLRELNAAIEKRNATIDKYEREKKDLQERNSYLVKKAQELNEGVRNSKDLTWKQKYEAILHASEQAINALQKKCQKYKNAEFICPFGDNAEIISAKKTIEKRCREAEKALEDEKQANKDLNAIINSKNNLLDEYMTKYNNLEHNYKEEVRMKEQFKMTCFKHERTIESQNSTIRYLKGQVANVKNFEKENCDLRRRLSIIEDAIKK